MNKGGVGYIDGNGNFKIPKYLLDSLGVSYGTLLWGAYYPKRPGKAAKEKIEFMLTPIPYKYWSRAALLHVRCRRGKQIETLEKVSSILNAENVTIVHIESTVNSHRYSNIRIHVALHLRGKLEFDKKSTSYKGTAEATLNLKERIESIGNKFLFKDGKDANLKKRVSVKVNTALQYFHSQVESRKDKNDPLHKEFTLRYDGEKLKAEISSNTGQKVIYMLGRLTGEPTFNEPRNENSTTTLKDITNTLVFGSIDTWFGNLRIRIIPRSESEKMTVLRVNYRRHWKKKESKPEFSDHGLIAHVTKKLTKSEYGLRIWKFYNDYFEMRDEFESGVLTFICSHEGAERMRLHSADKLMKEIENLEGVVNYEGNTILKCKFHPFDAEVGQDDFEKRLDIHDVRQHPIFLSYSVRNSPFAEMIKNKFEEHGLGCYMAEHEIQPGDLFNDIIRDAIKGCEIFCILYTKQSQDSQWITTEWGAAWANNKKIVPILIEQSPDVLPDRLLSRHVVRFHELDDFVLKARNMINPLIWK